jgi:hypothetical protein
MDHNCPICFETWKFPANVPLRLECRHLICRDCHSKLLDREDVVNCPLCRYTSIDHQKSENTLLETQCGMLTRMEDITTPHLESCDSCWSEMVSGSVNTSVFNRNPDHLKRFLNIGHTPSELSLLHAFEHNYADIVYEYVSHERSLPNLRHVLCAAEFSSLEILGIVLDHIKFTPTHIKGLTYLYRIGKVDQVVLLWDRGFRENKLVHDVVVGDDSEVLGKIYDPHLIFPDCILQYPQCAHALMALGHRFSTQNLHVYLGEVDKINMGVLNRLISTQRVVLRGEVVTSHSDLMDKVSMCGHFNTLVWLVSQGLPRPSQHLINETYKRFDNVSVKTLLNANIMPTYDILGGLSPGCLRVIYGYQCSECEVLTSRKCPNCNVTRFCGEKCELRGAPRHGPFCCEKSDMTLVDFTTAFDHAESADLQFEHLEDVSPGCLDAYWRPLWSDAENDLPM